MDTKRIAWDSVSFAVPKNWELAVYRFLKRGVTRIEIEDEYAVRLEAEWIRPRKRLTAKSILSRYERSAKKLTRKADRRESMADLPRGWHGTLFAFREIIPTRRKTRGLSVVRHDLVTAFYLCPQSSLFCFMLLHFLPQDEEDPKAILRLLTESFRHHDSEELAPWSLFDIAFTVPRDFRLESTSFDIGAKQMVFRWKLRRFHLWHFSCADMFLTDGVVMEEWVTGHVNGYGGFKGVVFFPGTDGEILWRRRRRHPLGHRDEISRWCFRYRARCRYDQDRNQLVAWVFNYRRPEDLRVIPEDLRLGMEEN